MPKLSITSLEGRGAVATLNRWADQLGQTVGSNAQAISGLTRNVVALQNAPPPPPGISDGLIHGQSPWESDPSFIEFRDDFISPSAQTIGGAFTSEQAWFFTGSESAKSYGLSPKLMGGILLTCDGTSNHGSFLIPAAAANYSAGSVGWAIFDNPGWIMNLTFTIMRGEATVPATLAPPFSYAKTSLYLGFGANPAASSFSAASPSPRPNYFVGLRYDTDTTSPSIADSTFWFEAVCNSANAVNLTRSNVQGNTFNTSITPTEGRQYRLTMICTAVGQVQMTLVDGFTSATTTLTVPNYSFTGASYFIQDLFAAAEPNGVVAPASTGSSFTVAGTGNANIDGTHVAQNSASAWMNFITAGVNVGNTFAPAATFSGLPALAPWIAIFNDTSSTPTAFAKAVIIDLISFLWNPGVGGGTGTPNSIKARYF